MKDFVVVENGEEWVKSAFEEKTLKAVQRMNSVKNASAAANPTVGVGQRPEWCTVHFWCVEPKGHDLTRTSAFNLKRQLLAKHGVASETLSSLSTEIDS